MPIKEIGRKHGFSDASFYKWRSKYGGMDASEAKRLWPLELNPSEASHYVEAPPFSKMAVCPIR